MNELGVRPEHECFDTGHVANLDPLTDMGLVRALADLLRDGRDRRRAAHAARNRHMADQIPGGAEGPNNWGVIGISRDRVAVGGQRGGARGQRARRRGGQLLPA